MQGHVLVIYGLWAQNSHNCFELRRLFGPIFPDFILLQMLVFFFLLSFFNNITYGFVCRFNQFSSIPILPLSPISNTGDSEWVSQQRWTPCCSLCALFWVRARNALEVGSAMQNMPGLAIQKVRVIIILDHPGLQTCKYMRGLFHSSGTLWITPRSAGLSTCLDGSQLIKIYT